MLDIDSIMRYLECVAFIVNLTRNARTVEVKRCRSAIGQAGPFQVGLRPVGEREPSYHSLDNFIRMFFVPFPRATSDQGVDLLAAA